LDTVVGLSLAPTSVGWVLVEGRDAAGTILDHDDFPVHTGGGTRAVNTAEQTMVAVLEAQAAAASHDQRLHVIGVTWSDEAAAEAALLLESVTHAGFNNVVPIRLHDACDMLARAAAPVVGYQKAAVCVLDGDSSIVVMVDTCDDEPQTAIKELTGGGDRLVQWLTALFDRSAWQPGGIVIVGPDADLDALSWRLEKVVPVPVITHSDAQLALARGAALAAAQSTEFTDPEIVETVDRGERERSRPNTYAGALTMLIAGAVTFVASLSLALGPHLVPDRGPVQQQVHRAAATTSVARVPAPQPAAVQEPVARSTPPPAPPQKATQAPAAARPQTAAPQEPSAALPAAAPIPPAPPAPPPPPPNPHPLLTKLLERLHGQPEQPAPAPPPNPGPPPAG
jgi:hypothetical protein